MSTPTPARAELLRRRDHDAAVTAAEVVDDIPCVTPASVSIRSTTSCGVGTNGARVCGAAPCCWTSACSHCLGTANTIRWTPRQPDAMRTAAPCRDPAFHPTCRRVARHIQTSRVASLGAGVDEACHGQTVSDNHPARLDDAQQTVSARRSTGLPHPERTRWRQAVLAKLLDRSPDPILPRSRVRGCRTSRPRAVIETNKRRKMHEFLCGFCLPGSRQLLLRLDSGCSNRDPVPPHNLPRTGDT